MIISPSLLRENMLSRLNSMLGKVKDKVIDLNSPVVLNSWNSFEVLHESGWKFPKKKGEYKISGAVCYEFKEISIIVQNSANDSLVISADTLNIEDMYKLYFEISNIITASTPAMVDTSEEMWKYDN